MLRTIWLLLAILALCAWPPVLLAYDGDRLDADHRRDTQLQTDRQAATDAAVAAAVRQIERSQAETGQLPTEIEVPLPHYPKRNFAGFIRTVTAPFVALVRVLFKFCH